MDEKKSVVVDLTTPEQATWLNQVRAARVKGAPLSKIERQRILDGTRWNGADDWRDDKPRPEDQDDYGGATK